MLKLYILVEKCLLSNGWRGMVIRDWLYKTSNWRRQICLLGKESKSMKRLRDMNSGYVIKHAGIGRLLVISTDKYSETWDKDGTLFNQNSVGYSVLLLFLLT